MEGLVGWDLERFYFLYQKNVPWTVSWYKFLSALAKICLWREIKRDVRRMRRHRERRSDNFRRSQDESQSDGKIICLESYVPMSSKTQSKQRGTIQPFKTVAISEYQKICYQICMHKSQDCQRQKGCGWNIYVTTLDYTLSLAHGFIFILSGFPIFNRYRCAQILM